MTVHAGARQHVQRSAGVQHRKLHHAARVIHVPARGQRQRIRNWKRLRLRRASNDGIAVEEQHLAARCHRNVVQIAAVYPREVDCRRRSGQREHKLHHTFVVDRLQGAS